VFRDLLRTYGPQRIMFGTDSTVPEEYRLAILAEQREVFERLIVADADRRAVFGENARRLFRLPGSKRA
jgi:predicted TIM-barrel fold metal-dependent hydrolase